MNPSTLFLSHISCVDHAFIDDQGKVKGGSYHPNFLVEGKVDPLENVVADFSSVKKEIKKQLDHACYGFDHKCWIIEGYSSIKAIKLDSQIYTLESLPAIDQSNQGSLLCIETESVQLELPYDSFKLIRSFDGFQPNGYSVQAAGDYFSRFLNLHFESRHIHIDCLNTESAIPYSADLHSPEFFRYTHGLPFSSSWGCQNLAHGHFSFIQTNAPHSHDQVQVIKKICDTLNHVIFIQRDNIFHEDDETIAIRYTTEVRGQFHGEFSKIDHKIIILDTETTIEHLVHYVAVRFREDLLAIHATQLYVSEGLSKGALVEL